MSQTAVETESDIRAIALAAAAKPRRYGGWYVAEHELRNTLAFWKTILATSLGNPLIYLFAMGVGVATLVDVDEGPGDLGGVSYLTFVAPALLTMAALTVAAEEFTFPILLGFKWRPIFLGMNAAPLQPGQIINGVVYSALVRLSLATGTYFVFMLLFGAVPSSAGFLAVPVAVLTGLAVGSVLMAYVATIEEDKGQLALIMRFVILPMSLFSGTFFPLETLPVFLRWIGWISPLWHGTELARVFAYGKEEAIWITAIHLLYLGALTVFGWSLARRIAARRLNK